VAPIGDDVTSATPTTTQTTTSLPRARCSASERLAIRGLPSSSDMFLLNWQVEKPGRSGEKTPRCCGGGLSSPAGPVQEETRRATRGARSRLGRDGGKPGAIFCCPRATQRAFRPAKKRDAARVPLPILDARGSRRQARVILAGEL
jgi:hypothetical protein